MVQSKRRVGRPWCCANASHSHIEEGGLSRKGNASFRKLSKNVRSMTSMPATVPNLPTLGTSSYALSDTPRKRNVRGPSIRPIYSLKLVMQLSWIISYQTCVKLEPANALTLHRADGPSGG